MRYTICRSEDVTEEIFLKECKAELPKVINRNPFSVSALRLIYSYLKNQEIEEQEETWLAPQSLINRFREDYFEQYFTFYKIPIDRFANADRRLAKKEEMKQAITQRLQGRLVGFVLVSASANRTLEKVVYDLGWLSDLSARDDLELDE